MREKGVLFWRVLCPIARHKNFQQVVLDNSLLWIDVDISLQAKLYDTAFYSPFLSELKHRFQRKGKNSTNPCKITYVACQQFVYGFQRILYFDEVLFHISYKISCLFLSNSIDFWERKKVKASQKGPSHQITFFLLLAQMTQRVIWTIAITWRPSFDVRL